MATEPKLPVPPPERPLSDHRWLKATGRAPFFPNPRKREMTPQEIADLSTSVTQRCVTLLEEKWNEEQRAIDAERARVQALCLEHTGHVFGLDPYPLRFGAPVRRCVYCGAREATDAEKDVAA